MLKKLVLCGLLGLSFVCTHEIKNELRFGYQYYEDNNKVSIHQPLGSASLSMGEKTAVGVQFLMDAISAASRQVFNPRAVRVSPSSGEGGIPLDAETAATERRKTYPRQDQAFIDQ